MSKYHEADLNKVHRYSVATRKSIVNKDFFAKKGKLDTSAFLESLPEILKAKDLRELVSACKIARDKGKAIIIGLGGHVIKCGLAPLLIELMEEGFASAFMVNGSVMIHDYEIAMFGSTSEDVAEALTDGSFGMAIETGDGINSAIKEGAMGRLGLGEALGKALCDTTPNKEYSLLASAYERGIPVTVHVALGTDIIHQHPSADGAAIGECSLRDFRILCQQLGNLNDGGVILNFGSAVIIPEVFLKALSVARNLCPPVNNFTTAVFDMNYHYRPQTNVVQRPVLKGGKGFYFIGHHEILIPLLVKTLIS
ncbi:MAG: hypothetical protein PHI68_01305 [Candidatus Cloacimonetes bacterium]|nr:hypothetical protein [Candidatus Cloacimonadota bacterium]